MLFYFRKQEGSARRDKKKKMKQKTRKLMLAVLCVKSNVMVKLLRAKNVPKETVVVKGRK
jgi:hypothetical protein